MGAYYRRRAVYSMENLEIVILLMAALALLYALANRLKLPYPVLLVVAGLLIGLVPGLPVVRLSPNVVFLVFLPPLLYEASFNTSWHDFKRYHRSISLLAIGLVLFTMAAVAAVAHYFIPGMTWALGFVLGAIVSPPDAVAATSATHGLGLPRRVSTILEGESLLNDASALIAYRYAVAAVVSGTFGLWEAGLQFLLVAGGGLALGAALGYLFTRLQSRVQDPTLATVLSLLSPFMGYVLAEHLHISGVLAVVATGLVMSWNSFEAYTFRTRIRRSNFWKVLTFLLNGFVFILIGLQLPAIMEGLGAYSLPTIIGYGLLISVVAIVVRLLWIYPAGFASYYFGRGGQEFTSFKEQARELFVVSWSGMRGVVSLATALALPMVLSNGEPFPQRNLILFITFCVILVTLVVQGLSLPWFVRRLGVQTPPEQDLQEARELRLELARAALTYIDSTVAGATDARAFREIRNRFEHRISRLENPVPPEATSDNTLNPAAERAEFEQILRQQLAVIEHERVLLVQLHRSGTFSEEAVRRVERELDITTSTLYSQLNAL
ncbi:Na+/H+ antiporter [Hymenobacter sediminis]|nr:Na+/H+ antiporter [Hymenobacter sediminis]